MRTPALSEEPSPAEPRREQAAVHPAAEALLDLQRGAGNAAVARLLASPPTTLGDFGGAVRSLRVDTDQVHGLDLDAHFTGPRAEPREGLSLAVHFSGSLEQGTGRTEADRERTEQSLRSGLRNRAIAVFNLDGSVAGPPTIGVTRIEELDLTRHGGANGRYRFTSVSRGADKAEVLIELLGVSSPPLENTGVMPEKRQKELRARFDGLGFTKGSGWSPDDFLALLQCLEGIPDSTLTRVPGIVFNRRPEDLGPKGEAGEYHFSSSPPVRELTLFEFAFSSDAELRLTVAHEIGHALSGRPREIKRGKAEHARSAAYKAAVKADGGLSAGITAYAATDLDEHFAESYGMFATEPELLAMLRPSTFAFFEALLR